MNSIDTSALTEPRFQLAGVAVSALERDLMRERVCAGIRNAKAKDAQIAALRAAGASWSQVCSRLGVSKGTAQRAVVTLDPGQYTLATQ